MPTSGWGRHSLGYAPGSSLGSGRLAAHEGLCQERSLRGAYSSGSLERCQGWRVRLRLAAVPGALAAAPGALPAGAAGAGL